MCETDRLPHSITEPFQRTYICDFFQIRKPFIFSALSYLVIKASKVLYILFYMYILYMKEDCMSLPV